MNRKLSAEQELDYLKELYGGNVEGILRWITNAFDVLQQRSALMLSLVAVVLTITGFSGPTVAASGRFSKICIAYGLAMVLAAAVLILAGPLQLRWATQWRGETMDASLVALIRRRNARTRKYHAAFVLLSLGLTGYVGSLLGYLFRL